MPKRKSVISRSRIVSKRQKLSRRNETTEEKEQRLTLLRENYSRRRNNLTEEQLNDFRESDRLRKTLQRKRRTNEQTESERVQNTIRMRNLRLNEQMEAQASETSVNAIREKRRGGYSLEREAFHYNSTRNYSEHPNVAIGRMNQVCKFCEAKKFKGEPPGICCSSGKIKLPELKLLPPEFLEFMKGETQNSKEFLQKIRSYNACFQMTSFGASAVIEEQGFNPVFKIQGQIYHKIGSLLSLPNNTPKFLQVYFVGNEEDELDQRLSSFTGLRRDIILQLQRFLHKNNELIKIFKTAVEKMVSDSYKIIIRADKRPIGEHERRFNAPQVNEIAVVMVDNESSYRDIVVQRRSNKLQRIVETHHMYDALQYPLIFCYGEDGYHFNIFHIDPQTNRPTNKKVSSKEFYAYRIMERENKYNHILNCRQLFLQFIVDMQAKIEAERLLFIRQNQNKLRTDEYIHLRDAVANDGDIENLGRLVILPSTFTGSPRHMLEYAQDAMTYVRKYGRPDLFITFTCNSSWKEIQDELQYGQKPHDRHDIIARVFKQKQVKFTNAIVKSCVFGNVISWMFSIEWQKRGLPHSHNLIWLKEKIHSNQIDDIIKAEFPNPVEDPILYKIIEKNMIHGPCGTLNVQSPCMKDNKCSKRYPRSFLIETQTGDDGYPKYRRRSPSEGGFTAKIRVRGEEIQVDNRWVVPYNPLLSKMFNAHINVEYCSSVKSIKYVCKYINKGSDMAVFGITDDNRHDEILRYQMGRYINSNEAVWRILGFPIHDRDPAVFHLAVHLENGQRVYFTNQTAQKVANQPVNTTLTAFFDLCLNDPFARTLFYGDVPSYYTWDSSRKVFNRRKRGVPVEGFEGVFKDNAIGRVYTVHPKNAECFYLRLLLHEVRGPTSFEDLRTVNGYICDTYREACQRRGLLENDNQWEQAMKEAAETATANQLRELFAIILTSCNPSNPNRLWLKYRDSMSDDILARLRRDNQDMNITYNNNIYNEVLIILEDRCFAMCNQNLVTLGVQSPERNEFSVANSELMKELNYNLEELRRYIEVNKLKMTQAQRIIYNTIINRIDTNAGGIIFLDAPGGTGKTFLINLILATIRLKNEIALALASSGIAATLMDGGKTAHSAFNLPLNVAEQEFPVCNITKSSVRGQILTRCKIIIWDECTMSHRKSLEAVDRTLQDLRKNTKLMGGVLLLLSGDFRQTLPVIPKSTPADEINACLKRSIFWNSIEKLSLTENMRALITGDPKAQEFADILLKIGNGTYPIDPQSGKIILSEELCNVVDTEEQLIEKIYSSIEQNYLNKSWLYERAILATKNDVVKQVNEKIQDMIPGEERIYKSIDTMMNQDENLNFPTEFLNSLNPPGMPSHELKLKIGSPVILIRNLNAPKLCNGTRLCVKQMLNNIIEAEILSGKDKGNLVFIPRIPLIANDLPFHFKRLQFPLRLAYSMTINKAQGQTFRFCGVNLKESCFSHGQLYVAFSRVGQKENLFVYAPEHKTVNVVYKNVFQ